ncbi:hypothetical protein EDB84DRAFT_1443348 [Lactarius hengduanensis]|nr:hypothetical protein EDB84DRAFT_1443348 [Lactarius hengduanensis]
MSPKPRPTRTPSPNARFGSTSRAPNEFPQRSPRRPSSRATSSASNTSTNWRQKKTTARTADVEPDAASEILSAWKALTSREQEAVAATRFGIGATPPLTLTRTPSPVQPPTNEGDDEFVAAARMLPDEEREELIDALLEYDDPCEEERWHTLHTIRDRHRSMNMRESAPLPPPASPKTCRDSAETRAAKTTPTTIPSRTPGPVLPTTSAPEKEHIIKQEELLQTLLADDYADDEELERALSDPVPDDKPTKEVEEWLNALIYGDNDDPAESVTGAAAQTTSSGSITIAPSVPPCSDSGGLDDLENQDDVNADNELSNPGKEGAENPLPEEFAHWTKKIEPDGLVYWTSGSEDDLPVACLKIYSRTPAARRPPNPSMAPPAKHEDPPSNNFRAACEQPPVPRHAYE